MIPPTSIDGTDITGATIDGTDVQEITVDGDVVFSAGPPAPIAALHQYRFEGNVNDSIGNADGSDQTSSGYSNDAAEGSQAKIFDGTDTVDISSVPNIGYEHSITFSIKTTQSGDTTILDFRPTNVVGGTGELGVFDFGSKFGLFDENSFRPFFNESLARDGSYHDITISFFGEDDDYVAYLDGQRQNSGFTTGYEITGLNKVIGEKREGGGGFDGLLDNLIIHSRPLNDTEVANLHS